MHVGHVQERAVGVMKGVIIFTETLAENSSLFISVGEVQTFCSTPPHFMSLHSLDGRDGAHSWQSNPMTYREHLGGLLLVIVLALFRTCPDMSERERITQKTSVHIQYMHDLSLFCAFAPTWRVYQTSFYLEVFSWAVCGTGWTRQNCRSKLSMYTDRIMLINVGEGVELLSDCQKWIYYFCLCLHLRPLLYFTLVCRWWSVCCHWVIFFLMLSNVSNNLIQRNSRVSFFFLKF